MIADSKPVPAPIKDEPTATPLMRWAKAVTQFLGAEFPRGKYPQGPTPSLASVTTMADSVRVRWIPESSGAIITHYCVWKAAAGTNGTPTSPVFTSAVREVILPGAKLSIAPVGSCFEWFDMEFSASDRLAADRNRFRYWITSMDNQTTTAGQLRESAPVPVGYAVAPGPTAVDIGLYAPGAFTLPNGTYTVIADHLTITGTQEIRLIGNSTLRLV